MSDFPVGFGQLRINDLKTVFGVAFSIGLRDAVKQILIFRIASLDPQKALPASCVYHPLVLYSLQTRSYTASVCCPMMSQLKTLFTRSYALSAISRAKVGVMQIAEDAPRQTIGVVEPRHGSRYVGFHHFRQAARIGNHNGRMRRHRFKRDDAERLVQTGESRRHPPLCTGAEGRRRE